MQSVSEAWIQNQEQTIVSEGFIRIRYRIGDPDSQYDGVASATDAYPFSTYETIANGTNKNIIKYAYLDQDIWSLDGTCNLIDNVPTGYVGYMGENFSNENDIFSVLPTITLTWPSINTPVIPGITVTWSSTYDSYATDFTVDAYNGTTLINSVSVTGNTQIMSYVSQDISGYNKIVITVQKWSKPYYRARIEEIYVGAEQIYNKNELMSVKWIQEVDLLSGALPKTQVNFALDNSANQWNPDNPSSTAKYMMQQQELYCECGFKLGDTIEWIPIGRLFLNQWDISQNGITANFGARDILDFMTSQYTGTLAGTLYDICETAFTQADIPLLKDDTPVWIIDESLKNITVTAPENYDYSIAETLQLCANAARCVMYQDRNGMFYIQAWEPTLTNNYYINQDNSFKNSEYNLSREIASITVNKDLANISYSAKGEVININNPFVQSPEIATQLANWTYNIYKNRKCVSGELRMDPRLDALDYVTLINKFATSDVVITALEYTFTGMFRGKYEGRIM